MRTVATQFFSSRWIWTLGARAALAVALLAMPVSMPSPMAEITNGFGLQLAATPAAAGSITIGGRRMSCNAARVVQSKSSPHIGYAEEGKIVVNPRLLRKFPAITRRIIFLHECGHQYVGNSETGADCWAIRSAKRQGWLTEKGVRTVCRSFANDPGSSVHLPGPQRCQAMLSCYRNAKGRKRQTAGR